MITRNMNTDEVLNELRKIDDYVCGRWDGLKAKNNQKLKSKFVGSDSVMSVSKYVVPNTKDNVVVFAVKHIEKINGKDYSTMYLNHYVKTYYGTYIIAISNIEKRNIDGYIEFTCHAIERIRERLGKDFETFFKEDYIHDSKNAFKIVEDNYKADKTELVARIGGALVIIEKVDNGKKLIIKTVLSEKELFSSQMLEKEESQEGGEAAWATMVDNVFSDFKSNFRYYKSSGLLQRIV